MKTFYFQKDCAFVLSAPYLAAISQPCQIEEATVKSGFWRENRQGNGLNSLKISVVSKTCRAYRQP